MGDRIGLQVKDYSGSVSEVIIHSHWMGRELIVLAQKYLKERGDIVKEDECERIVYDFIWWIGTKRIATDIDLQTEDDDCEDNGVWTLDVAEGVIE